MLVNIGSPSTIVSTPEEALKFFQSIQDMSFEMASVYIQTHNAFVGFFYMFTGIEEIDMGNKLPKLMMPKGFNACFGHISDEVRKHLP